MVAICPYNRCFGFLHGSEIVSAGLQTKDACDKTEIEELKSKFEQKAGLSGVVPYCCSWSYCNFNESSLTMTDPSAPLLQKLEGWYFLHF